MRPVPFLIGSKCRKFSQGKLDETRLEVDARGIHGQVVSGD